MGVKEMTFPIFLMLIFISGCIPDSLTKFKEDAPSTSATLSSGGSVETVSADVVFNISSVDIYQSAGDILLFDVSDLTGFAVGDSLNISSSIVGPATHNNVATVHGLYDLDSGNRHKMSVQINGGFLGEHYFQRNYYIDNCASGYGTCGTGVGAAIIFSEPAFYISSGNQPAGGRNFEKAITITGTSSRGYNAGNLVFDYEFSPEQPQGLGIDKGLDGLQSDDRLVSPYGPFLPNEDLNYLGDSSDSNHLGYLKLRVWVNYSYYGQVLDDEEEYTVNIAVTSSLPEVTP